MIGARLAQARDAQSIARIEVEAWQTTYAGALPDDYLLGLSIERRRARWARELRPGHGVWVWQEDPQGIVGFGHCGRQRGTSPGYDGEIYMLYLLPDAQARGVGRQLLLAMLEWLRNSGCRLANIATIGDRVRIGRVHQDADDSR